MTNKIRQEVTFATSSQRVYETLTDAKQFSAFSGEPAEIDAKAGGAFSCFGGMITGRNVELKPGQRIVQAWRAGNWPEGVYSIVKFELEGVPRRSSPSSIQASRKTWLRIWKAVGRTSEAGAAKKIFGFTQARGGARAPSTAPDTCLYGHAGRRGTAPGPALRPAPGMVQ